LNLFSYLHFSTSSKLVSMTLALLYLIHLPLSPSPLWSHKTNHSMAYLWPHSAAQCSQPFCCISSFYSQAERPLSILFPNPRRTCPIHSGCHYSVGNSIPQEKREGGYEVSSLSPSGKLVQNETVLLWSGGEELRLHCL
jgi:hypothetical protein